MQRVFRKEKMLARLRSEGRIGLVGPDEYAIMDRLDGCTGDDNNWRSVVYIMHPDTHEGMYVALVDCD